MKIDPKTILPQIFSVHYPDGWHHLLACGNRIYKSGTSDQPGKGKGLSARGSEWKPGPSFDHVLFPVMIDLPFDSRGLVSDDHPVNVHYGVSGDDRRWTISPPSLMRIGEHAARHAIAEAWRGVVESKLDAENLLPHHHFDLSKMIEYKGGTPLWMLNAWVRWDEWNRRGYNLPQKAKQLEKLGFKVDPKQIKNASDVRAMPKALKE